MVVDLLATKLVARRMAAIASLITRKFPVTKVVAKWSQVVTSVTGDLVCSPNSLSC